MAAVMIDDDRGDEPSDNDVKIARIRLWTWPVRAVSLAAVILATAVPAHELAGHDTNVNVTVSLAATLTAALSGGAGMLWGRAQKHRADALEQRNRELQNRLSNAQRELQQQQRLIDLTHRAQTPVL